MRTILVVRHGETELNTGGDSAERIRGWIDIPLDPTGKQQAERAARRIAQLGKPVRIYTSDLVRATATAQAIKDATKAPVIVTKKLRPWDVGDYAGEPVKNVLPELKKLVADPEMKAPNGESFIDFVTRFLDIIPEITQLALVVPQQPTVVVTHSRNVRALMAWIDGGVTGMFKEPANFWFSAKEDPIEPGGILEIQYEHGDWVAKKV